MVVGHGSTRREPFQVLIHTTIQLLSFACRELALAGSITSAIL